MLDTQTPRLTLDRILWDERAYWLDRLPREPVEPALIPDHAAPERGEERDGVAFALDDGAHRALWRLSRGDPLLVHATLLAALQLCLARYAGYGAVFVGSPPRGGTAGADEPNALAIAGRVEPATPFRDLLLAARQSLAEAYTRQSYPFPRLLKDLGLDGAGPGCPLFAATLALEGFHAPLLDAGEALRIAVRADEHGVEGTVLYPAARYRRETVEAFAGHFAHAVGAALAAPGRPAAEMEVMRPGERRRVLEQWNATARPFPRDLCVHELFEAQAARTPDADAVEFGDGRLSYAGLNARANRLARALRRRGVGPETVVALLLERSPELVVAILGILKAGGAYLPLDPEYPAERLRYMREDSGARVLVTRGALLERLGDSSVEDGIVLRVDADAPEVAGEDETNLSTEAGPENLAYVIYTSGSTGRPKGAAIRHRGVANYLAWFGAEVLGGEAYDLPLISRLSFDAAVRQIYPPLLSGGRVWILPEEVLREPAALAGALGGRERLVVGGVPSLWAMLLEQVEAGDADLPGLRKVLLGGEALGEALVARTRARFPGVEIWNHYGPTEATVNTTVLRVEPGREVTLGRPVANVRLYVVDAAGSPVPAGVPGELLVGGEGVGRGYLGRPALTAERFVPDPFAAEPGARLYRSGDRVRWRADGELRYLGRIDEQVKVRGFRVEPGEIERALERHPSVRRAVVAARADGAGASRLVAWVVGEGGAEPDAAALRAHLAAGLPDYMVPGAIVALEALPLTPSGKVDRRALPDPGDDAARAGAYVAPRTATEEALAGIWREVLEVERVGVEENFFALGGHSLVAMRVVSRVRQAFAVELPMRAVFEAQTVAELAVRVDLLRAPGGPAGVPPIVPVPRDGALPLSFAQQRLWFLDQLEPGSAVYNVPVAVRVGGALEPAGLAWALTEEARRHEVLRTTFGTGADGEAVQVVHDPAPVRLPVVDLSAVDEGRRDAVVARLAGEEAARPFDLARGPVLRCTVLRLEPEDAVVLFTLHHIASDAWSSDLLVREVAALYGAWVRGEDARLPDLPVQYADYAVWQRRWLEGEVLDRQLAYWKARLAGAPAVLELPTDRPRAAVTSARGGLAPFTLPGDMAAGLRALSRREGTTLFMTALAGVAALLARYGGEPDVVVGTPIANRSRAETEGLIGFFLNTLALRIDLSGDPTVRELLGRVRETALGAFAHQDLPFERMVGELGVERSLGHTPLFQALFTLETAHAARDEVPPEPGGLRLARLGTESGTAKFDLDIGMIDHGTHVSGVVEYRAGLFEPETIERMVGHLRVLLAEMAAAPGRRLSALEILPADERRRVVEEWNATARDYPTGLRVHDLFAAQAARTPDASALVFRGQTLAYAAVDARANRLAHHLRGLGVGPEARVGICLERTPELVVSLLAVLKAGGAYVPLDPAYPRERLGFM
ncbi:MAG TPA: amino acid adenylation domain-containing protein, partial [Longimicrobium sp.]|nr:amino acid adenylation domain-containing protein [Longimicrobium sp.]